MKLNSMSQVNQESSNNNFFNSALPQQNSGMNTSQYSNMQRPQNSLQIFGNQSEVQPQQYRSPMNQPQTQTYQNQRNQSPNRMRHRFEQDNKNSITSFDRNQMPKRPLSQVPSYNRNPVFAENQNQQIVGQRVSQMNNQQPTPQPLFMTTNQSISQYNQTGNPLGMSRDALRENITKKSQLINDLTTNKNFFRENLERKNNEFKDFIRTELKKNVYE